jgi:mono/diheme cytochrome c family protein
MPTPSNPGTSAPAATVALTPEAEARQVFDGRCSVCHGAQGVGDGPGAAALNPRPRNFHDPAWQAGVTDAQIENIIRVGGAAVGKSPLMAANPDLVAKPAVVAALRAIVRGFR